VKKQKKSSTSFETFSAPDAWKCVPAPIFFTKKPWIQLRLHVWNKVKRQTAKDIA